jgi:hypothetical protein
MTNIIGCGVGVVCLLLYYLPFGDFAAGRESVTKDAGAAREA